MSNDQLSQPVLACPFCGGELLPSAGALRCAESHSFDLARQGYVNLTVGRHPGDTKEMLLARRAFLDAGYYQPLSLAINQRVAAHLVPRLRDASLRQHSAILDAGCGEGYFTERLATYLADSSEIATAQVDLFGLDISKDGIRLAAKRAADSPAIFFIAANLKAGLPFRSASLQVLLNVFAPRNPAEFARVLVPGGLLLIVIPAPQHLQELRASLPLLQIEEHKRERVLAQLAPAFSLLECFELTYQLSLTAEAVAQLLAMTPTRRRTGVTEGLDGIERAPLRVTAGFTLLALIRS